MWRIFSQPGKIGSGKNTKSLFFLLGLKYTCFESKNFLLNSCPELSLSNLLVVSEMDRQIQFQFFTSGGHLLTYWMILRSFPEWCFYVSVKSRFLEALVIRQADGKLKNVQNLVGFLEYGRTWYVFCFRVY